MTDPRVIKLADNLVNYSVELQPGENILIESIGANDDLVRALIAAVYAAGGKPFLWRDDNRTRRALLMGASEEQLKLMAENDGALMRQMQAYIGIRGADNSSELSDCPTCPQSKMPCIKRCTGTKSIAKSASTIRSGWCFAILPLPWRSRQR